MDQKTEFIKKLALKDISRIYVDPKNDVVELKNRVQQEQKT